MGPGSRISSEVNNQSKVQESDCTIFACLDTADRKVTLSPMSVFFVFF